MQGRDARIDYVIFGVFPLLGKKRQSRINQLFEVPTCIIASELLGLGVEFYHLKGGVETWIVLLFISAQFECGEPK
jgi:hypothetical protein